MARLKKHFETLRAIRSRDFVSAEMAICKSFNDINNHNANALQDCLEKDNGLNLVSEGRPREERAEFIITSASSRYVVGKMARGGNDATVQACFATWKIVCKVDDEEDRNDFYPFLSSPSVLRPFHHVSRYVNGNQQLPNINGWPSPRGLSHTSIGPFCRTCISINSPACYNQTLNGRLDDRCLLQNFPRRKQCLRDDVRLSTAQPIPSYPRSE
ncbi:hypothetical protein ALC60_12510 [Trachymyrmex zeteki]|uniref:Uncharacterized protein n=1 Tax=Mycetomoellerius zeteki TaxID=64791 RepID=A0A151WKS6_9HYME|nr:hypothetical protein ALC60_12510 [Trachymyrmex zeteki]